MQALRTQSCWADPDSLLGSSAPWASNWVTIIEGQRELEGATILSLACGTKTGTSSTEHLRASTMNVEQEPSGTWSPASLRKAAPTVGPVTINFRVQEFDVFLHTAETALLVFQGTVGDGNNSTLSSRIPSWEEWLFGTKMV